MKKYYWLLLTAMMLVTIIVISCSKIEGRTDDLPALNAQDNDLNAGNWKTVLLSHPDTFLVAAPATTTSGTYVGELNEVKALQQNLTAAQKAIVKYWSAGAVLRWNEIMRELVAKHNLPPYQQEDGTYPIPNATNPFNYPQFPFSNPPYAARAYAYVSAAQYDALVSAWHYKMLYNRLSPYQADSFINANKLVPASNLPSYPSEDAVVAGVTAEMMKMLFPTEIAFIEQKAAEAEEARLLAGANVRSDLVAGEALGRAVAQVFIARGKTDNAGKAGGTQADWDKMAADCVARGEKAWISLESPKRPPMLPMFGNVKPFLFDSAACVALRPGPPPSTGSEQMKQETEEIYQLVNHPTREHIRIVQFWADGVATYTPAGHWDAIAAEDFIKKNWSEVRWARNMALLNMSLMDAAIVCWNTKNYYYNPRPSQMNPAIKTLTGLPNFPSYISGHSTFSGAAAEILGHIVPERAADYAAMAQEASLSRMYGGIHFRSDCQVGLEVGKKIGDYAIARATTDGAE
ncbi:phosphatase PAP2 family protein [Ilyomonas limi]|uniref:Phosphatase PAP2 family protein n=1 Tax=Ilyomonas limi TaxID=2575867 RepID=A0A4V5UUV1_9BACT|nr:phosphatase PAP2 family protein [Ilyomonas limi]TKK70193.1 phosphatase PAP2 family protein [Ilyomonas limi]